METNKRKADDIAVEDPHAQPEEAEPEHHPHGEEDGISAAIALVEDGEVPHAHDPHAHAAHAHDDHHEPNPVAAVHHEPESVHHPHVEHHVEHHEPNPVAVHHDHEQHMAEVAEMAEVAGVSVETHTHTHTHDPVDHDHGVSHPHMPALDAHAQGQHDAEAAAAAAAAALQNAAAAAAAHEHHPEPPHDHVPHDHEHQPVQQPVVGGTDEEQQQHHHVGVAMAAAGAADPVVHPYETQGPDHHTVTDHTAEAEAAVAVASASAEDVQHHHHHMQGELYAATHMMAEGSVKPPAPKRQRLSWNDRYEQLKEFKAENGHCNVAIRYKNNKTLGKWCNNMREQYKIYLKRIKAKEEGDDNTLNGLPKCPMNSERVRLLEEIGFQWSTNREDTFDKAWERRLEELKAFKAENNHCQVPHGYKENPVLAEWVHRQRCTYSEMKKREAKGETLKAKRKSPPKPSDRDPDETVRQRMAILEELGFSFKVKEASWTDRYEQLKRYKEGFGDCNVPITFAENPSLGRWVHTQRHQEKLRREKRTDGKRSSRSAMTEERKVLLDEIGFSWEVRNAKSPKSGWEERYSDLKAFHVANGHCAVPPVNVTLNRWCHEQKASLEALVKDGNDAKARKKLTDDRIRALNAIGFTHETEVPSAPDYMMPINVMAASEGHREDHTSTAQDHHAEDPVAVEAAAAVAEALV